MLRQHIQLPLVFEDAIQHPLTISVVCVQFQYRYLTDLGLTGPFVGPHSGLWFRSKYYAGFGSATLNCPRRQILVGAEDITIMRGPIILGRKDEQRDLT